MLSTANTGSFNKPRVIIGAGPVGSMMAAMLITFFPDYELHLFDRHYTNVRGHGLGIHAATISEMKANLLEAKNKTQELLNKNVLTDARKIHYATILKRINYLITYLESGQFIRTFKISEIMQNYCKEVGNGLVHFHLKSEVTAEDLTMLMDDSIKPANEKQAILKQADLIFGADGSHSGVRKTIFNETTDDLSKYVLSYLLEINLEMTEKPNKFLDKLTHSVVPAIKSGQLPIWSQNMDGTATLHVFIDKKVYDILHVKDRNGNFKGSFANPYRRLIDLPDQLKDEIERMVVDIIDADKMHASTLKITTTPIHVDKARKLVHLVKNKRIVLVGDSGIDLVLARGANGFYAASDYALSLYNEHLDMERDKELSQHIIPDFIKYQEFWDAQHDKLNDLLNYIDRKYPMTSHAGAMVNRQIQILDEYEKKYKEILIAYPFTDFDYVKHVTGLENNFYDFISRSVSLGDTEIKKLVSSIFEKLKDKNYLSQYRITHLHQSQGRLLARANLKIEEAKFENKLLQGVKEVYDTSHALTLKSSGLFLDDDLDYYTLGNPKLNDIRKKLNELRNVIFRYDLTTHPEYERFVFLIDRMYLAIERAAKQAILPKMISFYAKQITDAITFLTDLPRTGTRASDEYLSAHPFINENLVQEVINLGNYLFNQARRVQQINDKILLNLAKNSIQVYPEYKKKNGGIYEAFFGYYHVNEANTYFSLLSLNKIRMTTKLILLYSLFKHPELELFARFVFKSMLRYQRDADHIDIQVLCEVLQNKIMLNLGTRQFEIVSHYAYRIIQAINDKEALTRELINLEDMLSQFESIMSIDADRMIKIATDHLLTAGPFSRTSGLSLISEPSCTSLKTNSIFKSHSTNPPEYITILKNDAIHSPIKLSILYVLLTNTQNTFLQRNLAFAYGDKQQPGRVAEAVENKLKSLLYPEQLSDFESAMYKLTTAINNQSTLDKSWVILNELFSPTQNSHQFGT